MRMLKTRTQNLFCGVCLLLFGLASFPTDGKIVFNVDRDLFVMNDDGSRRRRLTQNPPDVKDRRPRWSPDGTQIAFTRHVDLNAMLPSSEIFIMNADGTDPIRLTHNWHRDGYPSWSPDGRSLVFSGVRVKPNGDERLQVFVIDIETREVTQLTGIEDSEDSTAPDWSPDGNSIVFERFIPVKAGIAPKTIYTMSAAGMDQRRILPDPLPDDPLTFRFVPRWSSDGQRVLFYEVRWFPERDDRRFFIQQIGGRKTEVSDIKERLGYNWMISGACWAEDDSAMLFAIKRTDKVSPNYDIYRYSFETRGLRRITRDPRDERSPDWAPGALSVSPHGKLTTQWAEIKTPEE